MLETNKREMEGLNIDFQLDDKQRAILASAVHQEWFDLIQKLMEEEIRKLNVHHINVPEDDEKAIVATFRIAKGAAMFYAGFFQRLQSELALAKSKASGIGTIERPEEIQGLDIESAPHPEE